MQPVRVCQNRARSQFVVRGSQNRERSQFVVPSFWKEGSGVVEKNTVITYYKSNV